MLVIYKESCSETAKPTFVQAKSPSSVCMVMMILRFFLFARRAVGFVLNIATFRWRYLARFYCSWTRFALRNQEGSFSPRPKVAPAKWRTVISYRFVKMACAGGLRGGAWGWRRVARVGAASARRSVQPRLHLPCRNHDTLATSHRTACVTPIHCPPRHHVSCHKRDSLPAAPCQSTKPPETGILNVKALYNHNMRLRSFNSK